MFVGHYGLLFLGVQAVDLLFFPLVASGVERMTDPVPEENLG